MKLLRIIFLFFLLAGFVSFGHAQNDTAISFELHVYDDSTGLPMPGVSVFFESLKNGGITDSLGFFKIDLPKGIYSISVSSIGYVNQLLHKKIEKDVSISISLKPAYVITNMVTVYGESQTKNVETTQMGVSEIKMEDAKSLPVLMGEVDPIKLIQLSSGVQTSGDGNTGLYIRGGSPGQNLLLIDGAPIYNPAHLMGFFSVFNADAIDKVKLTKSAIPASFGGRSSSLIEVDSKSGSMQTTKVSGGIGLLTSKLCVEGPLVKNKLSYIICARRSYFEALQPLVKMIINKPASFFTNTNYYFYDLNAQLKFIATKKDILKLNLYSGADHYLYSVKENQEASINWGNSVYSLKWMHFISDNSSLNQIVYATGYSFGFNANDKDYSFNLASGVKDLGYKLEFYTKKSSRHAFTSGIEYVYHTYSPVKIEGDVLDVELQFAELTNMRAHELACFLSDDFHLSKRFLLNFGMRYSWYNHTGPFSEYSKDAIGQVVDTLVYSKKDVLASYIFPEPRISIRYLLQESTSLKASFTSHVQYTHYASLPSVSMPFDIWLPSTMKLAPEKVYQGSVGLFKNLRNNMFESSLEVYYRMYHNLIEFKRGVLNSAFEQSYYNDIAIGTGKSYGAEISFKKKEGKFTGWFVYTLSHSTRQFDEINEGKEFVSTFDRIHDASCVLNYQIKKWTFSTCFIYATGNAITLPEKLYIIQENIISEYAEKNSFRLPSYNRLDISVTYNFKKRNHFESALSVSVYNVYNRANPFYISFETQGDLKKYKLSNKATQVSLFPVLPAITWNFKF